MHRKQNIKGIGILYKSRIFLNENIQSNSILPSFIPIWIMGMQPGIELPKPT